MQNDSYAIAQDFIKSYQERTKFQSELLCDLEEGLVSLETLDA